MNVCDMEELDYLVNSTNVYCNRYGFQIKVKQTNFMIVLKNPNIDEHLMIFGDEVD